jgi:DNA invertase Pin-like site-specific DNA recombinase
VSDALESPPPKLIGYSRVSTEEQSSNGVSLDAQADRIAAYCKAQGFELVRVEVDAGVSGSVRPDRRPALARALASVRDGEAEGVVALKLDRLSRNTKDVLNLAEEFDNRGWRLISVSESLDTGSAIGEFTLTILAALSQMERKQIAERTRMGLAQVAREGRARSRMLPFGYRSSENPESITTVRGDRSKLVPYPPEQTVLAEMLKLRDLGYGPRKIARTLNDASILHPRSNRPWQFNQIQGLLRTAERRRALEATSG